MGFGFDFLFSIFPILFLAAFVLFFGIMISALVKNAKTAKRNSASPKLTVNACVVSKRTQIGSHRGTNSSRIGYTNYFATFQVESGDRFELELDGSEYGLIVEGDRGRLSFQGSRYLGFEREWA